MNILVIMIILFSSDGEDRYGCQIFISMLLQVQLHKGISSLNTQPALECKWSGHFSLLLILLIADSEIRNNVKESFPSWSNSL